MGEEMYLERYGLEKNYKYKFYRFLWSYSGKISRWAANLMIKEIKKLDKN
jgi:hypothetical protein